MLGPVLDKAHRCRIDGARHDVDETRHPCGNSPPYRDLENFLGELRDPREDRRTPRDDHPCDGRVFKADPPDLPVDEGENLFQARLNDLTEHVPAHDAGAPTTETAHLDLFLSVDQCGECTSIFLLDLFRFVDRRAQADGDIVGDVISPNR